MPLNNSAGNGNDIIGFEVSCDDCSDNVTIYINSNNVDIVVRTNVSMAAILYNELSDKIFHSVRT